MKKRAGFTLVEMLVVIGIIGLLATAMVVSLSGMRKVAMQGEAQKLVTEVYTAFNILLQNERNWPQVILDNANKNGGINADVCAVFQSRGLIDLSTWKTGKINTEINWDSLDRFGLLDPYGKTALKKSPSQRNMNATIVDGVGTYKDHLLQYRIDKNFDGYVDSTEGAPNGYRIRAAVIVWSRGPDGKDDDTKGGRYPDDDRGSWTMAGVSK